MGFLSISFLAETEVEEPPFKEADRFLRLEELMLLMGCLETIEVLRVQSPTPLYTILRAECEPDKVFLASTDCCLMKEVFFLSLDCDRLKLSFVANLCLFGVIFVRFFKSIPEDL